MHAPRDLRRGLAAVVILMLAACGAQVGSAGAPSAALTPGPSPALLWPAPSDPMDRTREAGLEPARQEFMTNHVHAHLDVFLDGEPILVPAGIGIDIENPDVRRFDEPDGSVAYGGIRQCGEPCISPLHTHDQTGVIHTESQNPQPNNLGEFFTEWGVPMTDSCVADFCSPDKPIAVYIAGEPYTGDPRAIELTDRKVIVVVIGTPPALIPSTADFSRA
jgi:hypothetical protein